LLVGCSEGGISGTQPVTGIVTYKGQPVQGAAISFIGDQEGMRVATAATGADGKYQLMTADTKGAMPGKYSVTVTKTETSGGAPQTMEEAAKSPAAATSTELLPAKYAVPATSPLKVEVKSGSNTIDLPLED
jgi:hypothetical protein